MVAKPERINLTIQWDDIPMEYLEKLEDITRYLGIKDVPNLVIFLCTKAIDDYARNIKF